MLATDPRLIAQMPRLDGMQLLAVGGSRALASTFAAAGATYATLAELGGTAAAAISFDPDAILIFASTPLAARSAAAALEAAPELKAVPRAWITRQPHARLPGLTSIAEPGRIDHFLLDVAGFLEQAVAPRAKVTEVKPRVVVAEHEPAIRQRIRALLEGSGCAVELVEPGPDLLARIRDGLPDLLVADVSTPEAGGWGLLHAVRSDLRVSETPVLLSGPEGAGEELQARRIGAQGYIVRDERFLERLRTTAQTVLAPRAALVSAFLAQGRAQGRVEELGLRWLIRRIGAAGGRAVISAHEATPSWLLVVENGNAVGAFARSPGVMAQGKAVLEAAIRTRTGAISVARQGPSVPPNLSGSIETLLDEAASRVQASEASALEGAMRAAQASQVDARIVALRVELSGRAVSSVEAPEFDLIRPGSARPTT